MDEGDTLDPVPDHSRGCKVKRRSFIQGTAAAAGMVAAPAIASGIRKLRLVTSWPEGSPGLHSSARRVARLITEASGGRLQVDVYGADQLVGAFEVFDAVAEGVADMYHSSEYYWSAKSPAFSFFTTVPYGFLAQEMSTWLHRGGGQALWDELSAQFNLKPLITTSTGVQMGGWFNKEIQSVESWQGLRCRIPGLGGEVIKRLGAVVVNLPGGEIVPSMKSGAIDAAEWVCPWLDLYHGLHEVARYYYYPGFHEPGSVVALSINKQLWDQLSAADRRLIEIATATEYSLSLADFNHENVNALRQLTQQHQVEVRRFPDEVLRELGRISDETIADIAAKDSMAKRVYQSFFNHRKKMMSWSEVSDRAFLNARHLAQSGQGG
ncbi:MAG: TRAP transporter substrate-binding protein [Gammaproteobacteria bacterium]|nr:TRAP transporter substrate-binding protein [Gammaproteobacteria bacterium]